MNSIEVLNSHNLKRTSCREGIIDVMLTAKEALSENEIRDKLLGNYDRTTFYRSFKTLEEHHILHRIVVDNLKVKYAVNPALTGAQAHAHFYCKECNTVLCLTHMQRMQYCALLNPYSHSKPTSSTRLFTNRNRIAYQRLLQPLS